MKTWVLKFREDGMYLYKNLKFPIWGPKQGKACRFKTEASAWKAHKGWPDWCRKDIAVMRLEPKHEAQKTSTPGSTDRSCQAPTHVMAIVPGETKGRAAGAILRSSSREENAHDSKSRSRLMQRLSEDVT